jgi:uncharacterized protein YndB with AHSA1/START domain
MAKIESATAKKPSVRGQYTFNMIWRFDVPIERVWEMINNPEPWPKWWKNPQSITKTQEGDSNGVGTVYHFVMQTELPYVLVYNIRTTRSERPHLFEGVVQGNLEGHARWDLSYEEPVTTARFTWIVQPTKPWMRLFTPILRPVFMWNHRRMMKRGGKGLARMIGAHLVGQKYF